MTIMPLFSQHNNSRMFAFVGTLVCVFFATNAAFSEAPLNAWQIFQQHCVRCHNPDTTRGGLDLSTHESALYGGVSMDTIVSGKPEASELWKRVRDGTMPPERDGRPLNAAEQAAVKSWIEQGAKPPEIKSSSSFVSQAKVASEFVPFQTPSLSCAPSQRRFPRRRNCR